MANHFSHGHCLLAEAFDIPFVEDLGEQFFLVGVHECNIDLTNLKNTFEYYFFSRSLCCPPVSILLINW